MLQHVQPLDLQALKIGSIGLQVVPQEESELRLPPCGLTLGVVMGTWGDPLTMGIGWTLWISTVFDGP